MEVRNNPGTSDAAAVLQIPTASAHRPGTTSAPAQIPLIRIEIAAAALTAGQTQSDAVIPPFINFELGRRRLQPLAIDAAERSLAPTLRADPVAMVWAVLRISAEHMATTTAPPGHQTPLAIEK
jgi:hypothetical protein